MKMWEVSYIRKNGEKGTEYIGASTYTMACLEFSVQFPDDYIILDMIDVTEVI